MHNFSPFVLTLFFLFSLGVLVSIINRLRQRATTVKHGVRVKGTIVGFTGGDSMKRYPMVRFQTSNGELLTLTSSNEASVFELKAGQIVDISYLEKTPEKFVIIGGIDALFE